MFQLAAQQRCRGQSSRPFGNHLVALNKVNHAVANIIFSDQNDVIDQLFDNFIGQGAGSCHVTAISQRAAGSVIGNGACVV